MFNYSMLFKSIYRKCSTGLRNKVKFSLHPKYEDTFQYWVLKRFENDNNYITWNVQNVLPKEELSLKLNTLNCEKLVNLISYAKQNNNTNLVITINNELEKKVCSGNISINEALPLLNYYSLVFPYKFTKSIIYTKLLLLLRNNLPPLIHHKLQALYYVSISKERNKAGKLAEVILKRVNTDELNSLSTTELAIFCTSLFRSSVQIKDTNVITLIKEKLKTELFEIIKDPKIFICFIKCLRYCKHYEDELFEKISNLPEDVLSGLPLISRIHMTIYFSDALFNDLNFMTKLINESIFEINKEINTNGARLKDVDNILWCAKQYSLKEITDVINKSKILDFIMDCADEERSKYLITVLNAFLSLMIMDFEKKDKIISYLKEKNVTIKNVTNFKDSSRISLLLSCCNIETGKNQFPIVKREEPSMGQHIAARPKFSKVLIYLKNNGQSLNLKNVEFCYPISCLYIASIKVQHKSGPINLEVIDEFVCLRNSSHLNGHMKLKLRLLDKLKIRTFQINLAQKEPTIDVLKRGIESCLQSL